MCFLYLLFFFQPGAGIGAIFVVAMVYASTATSAIAIVTVAITVLNFTASGPATNVVELAPKYAGVLMGITNFACNITGFISPEVVGALTVHARVGTNFSTSVYMVS